MKVLNALGDVFARLPIAVSEIILVCTYVVLVKLLVHRLPDSNVKLKQIAFAAINMLILVLLYVGQKIELRCLFTYIVIVIVLFLLMRCLLFKKSWWWLSAIAPIGLLASIRYAPVPLLVVDGQHWIGLSYMAFRLTQLVVIARNRLVPQPGILDYLNFAFFVPTMFVGPISAYSTFHQSYMKPDPAITPPGTCLLRMVIGSSKLLFLGSVCDQLSYRGFLFDGHFHLPIDVAIAAVAYYLYLYCNFSGFCDIVIGASGLIGIKVTENFNGPLLARNVKEFWNRWHITLSSFMRDLVFTPVSKTLVRVLPRPLTDVGIALAIALVFILIGVWHGPQLHYLLFGLAQAFGMVCNYAYGIILAKTLTKEQLRWYNSNKVIHCVAVVLTFTFTSASLYLFANTKSIAELMSIVKW